ncbi:MAG: ATP-binding protein [Lentimicrobiaceae bacterium]|nr:ATP-binding protein [Lentimicrobiaceae bacterium]
MKFVNRVEEQQRLTKVMNETTISLIVVYGRRRLGKSTLIKKILTTSDIYFLADQTEKTQQIRLLAKEIAPKIENFDKVIYPDWSTLFDTLNLRTTEKFTLCLDEFPYMVKKSPELPSIIQKIMDSKSVTFNLILCGSSQTMMQGLILDSKEPLYGRADQILKLAPISISYLAEYMNCSDIQAVEEYAIWGGIPRYWELRQKNKSLQEAIVYHIINSQGVLYEEPYRLLVDDMRDIIQASTLLSVIGAGANRLSEIAARVEKPATQLSRPLDKLIELGFIERETPFGENPKNSKKSLYKIADPFMNFYYRFVIPNRSLIELGRTSIVLNEIKENFNNYVSRHWECLCRKAVSGNTINGVTYNMATRWWGNISRNEMIEFDLMAQSMDKKTILVGECKWGKMSDSDAQIALLIEKARKLPFTKGKNIVPILFAKECKTISNNVLLPKDVLRLLG